MAEAGMEQNPDEGDEEHVSASRAQHIGLGLFCTVFGGLFGGFPLFFYILEVTNATDLGEAIFLSLFFGVFILIGIPIFLLGVALILAGVFNYPLMNGSLNADEGDAGSEAITTSFEYIDEDELLRQIHAGQTNPPTNEEDKAVGPPVDWPSTPSDDSPPNSFWNIKQE